MGKAPVGFLEKRSPPEAEAKGEISVHFLTLSCTKLGFNEYRSKSITLLI